MAKKIPEQAYNPQEYSPALIEAKWQKIWEKQGIYKTPKGAKNKKYILDMFPYPSGATMHVGHLEGYVGTDIICRYERMKGNAVLHPMGWDAFGLPAENYAIATGIHPYESTHKNIETFKRQLNLTGLSYDWDLEIDTSSPEYYKWNQWIFTLMFERGLAYRKNSFANWCPSCETVLANEQVVDSKCERCGTGVVQKEIEQWFLKITEYADRLISGLDQIDWLEEVKVQQKNWIGKSEGLIFTAPVKELDIKIQTFSTHFEAFYADTFVVIAPDHPLLESLVKDAPNKQEILNFASKIINNRKKGNYQTEGKAIEGIFTGRYIVDPIGNGDLPIWVASFALKDYGTGIVKCSAHDERDFAFAKKYGIKLKPVLFPKDPELRREVQNLEICYTDMKNGMLSEPKEFDGRKAGEIRSEIADFAVKKGFAQKSIQYHLRDWTISRQRYWGTPIPMIHCDICGWQPVPEKDLPVLLPKDVGFKPTGESPIAGSKSFQANVVCPKCGAPGRREVDTMDTYFDSSWYFIRFVDPKNDKEFARQEAIKNWLPVDVYVGGGHVVQHLLFARFFWKVLFDAGLIDKSLGDEPFLKLRAPGWILGPDSRKMSKRWGNVITPDDVIPKYGADAMRMYEMFMGPFEAMKPWNITGVEGVSRFMNRVWRLFNETQGEKGQKSDREVDVLINRLVKKVGIDIESMSFNTSISSMMETYNSLTELRNKGVKIDWREVWEKFLLVLAPFAPFITEELWNKLGYSESIHKQPWPSYDPKLIQETEVTVPVQINGRLRGVIRVTRDIGEIREKTEAMARESEKVSKYLEGADIKKIVFVPGRLINFVTR